MASIHERGQRILSTKLSPYIAKKLAKAARNKSFTPAKWRSLIYNATTEHTQEQIQRGAWTARYIVDCVERDSKELAPPTIKAQRTQRLAIHTPTGAHCPACKRDTLVVEFLFKSTGPGRKREEVRIANCSHCQHSEVPE